MRPTIKLTLHHKTSWTLFNPRVFDKNTNQVCLIIVILGLYSVYRTREFGKHEKLKEYAKATIEGLVKKTDDDFLRKIADFKSTVDSMLEDLEDIEFEEIEQPQMFKIEGKYSNDLSGMIIKGIRDFDKIMRNLDKLLFVHEINKDEHRKMKTELIKIARSYIDFMIKSTKSFETNRKAAEKKLEDLLNKEAS